MIRLLDNQDRKSVLEYLYKEANFNIFPIGDIEAFGLECSFQRVYGEFDENHQYLSIFLRYREHAIYYSHIQRFSEAYLEIFERDPFEHLSGKTELVELVYPFLIGFKRRTMYFCYANELQTSLLYDDSRIKVVQTKEECEKLYDLLATIPEFGIDKKDKHSFVEGKLQSLEMGMSLYMEDNDIMVSTVASTAETTKNAMVVAVATLKEYREKGYASILMHALMDLYINHKKKDLCLFYDNPKAGKIYLRLGFKNIGTWDMCEKEI